MADSTQRLEILIADDEESICFSLRRTLERKGYVVHLAADGKSVLDQMRRHGGRLSAAFLDIRMPKLDGLDACAAIRTLDRKLPVCLMTAFRNDPVIRAKLAELDVPVLDKPFSLSEFHSTLDRLIAGTEEQRSEPPPRTASERTVALVFPPQLGPWNEFIRGILRYSREDESWRVSIQPDDDLEAVLANKPDGVIAMVRTREAAARLQKWGGPVVDTAFDLPDVPFARIGFDDRGIGRLAAEHLLRLGTRTYCHIGIGSADSGRETAAGFQERLREAECECVAVPEQFQARPGGILKADQAEFADWLWNLPRPSAVFACHDAIALHVSETARSLGLRVPDDLAILGVLDDEMLCLASRPPLSSIRVPAPAVGYEAARILARMMAGRKPPKKRVELPPLGIAVRQSTEMSAAADPELAAALRFMNEHLAERIGVDDIVEAAAVSRSSLERRFRAALNRSPLEELLRLRVERAEHLLAETDASVEEVARSAGFRDAIHLSVTFRNRGRLPPARYRLLHRKG